MPFPYALVDVFTQSPFLGNGTAVVEAAVLSPSDAVLQKMAAALGLPATVFVFPPENPGHTGALKFFTPECTLPFIGHSALGAALFLARKRFPKLTQRQDCVLVLESETGMLRFAVSLEAGYKSFAQLDAPQIATDEHFIQDREFLAALLGLEPLELCFENHIPVSYTVGAPFVFVPVRDRSVLARCAVQPAYWAEAEERGIGHNFYIYTRETESKKAQFHARMFAPGVGVQEDPGSGLAGIAFARLLHRFDDLREGLHSFWIEQGHEMGRPCLLHLELEIHHKTLQNVRIGGHGVVIARGAFEEGIF